MSAHSAATTVIQASPIETIIFGSQLVGLRSWAISLKLPLSKTHTKLRGTRREHMREKERAQAKEEEGVLMTITPRETA